MPQDIDTARLKPGLRHRTRLNPSICLTHACPLPAGPGSSYCHEHERERDQARGTRAERGYDTQHDKVRAQLKPTVDAGLHDCTICQHPIQPGEPWHLHHNADRTAWLGPAHARCNCATATAA